MRVLEWAVALSVVVLGVAGCEASVPSGDVAQTQAPLLGDPNGRDSADHACNVVLRAAARSLGRGGFETDCSTGTCWIVWRGSMQLSNAAVDEGARPAVLYQSGSDPTWYEAPATPSTQLGATYYDFRLAAHTMAQGAAEASTRIQLAPFLYTSNGARLFDHNLHASDFDNYVLDASDAFAVDSRAVCRSNAAKSAATITFETGWRTTQHGAVVQGGSVEVDYDLARMPQCFASTYNGQPAWQTIGYARFLPGGQLVQGLLRGAQTSSGFASVPFLAAVPADATRVELWFLTSGEYCSSSWDSNLGANYSFEVVPQAPPAPTWAGDWGSSFDRACQHLTGIAEPVHVNSWTLTRACMFVDVDVYAPGLTDGAVEHPERLLAQAEVSFDGAPADHPWLSYVGRVGNNYRYRWTIDNATLSRVTWTSIAYSVRLSADGTTWFHVAQGDGPSGGAPRTLVHDPG